MSPEDQIEEAVAAIEWIQSAGKKSRELMFIDKIEQDFADEDVSIWFLSAFFNRIEYEHGEVYINDLNSLILEDREHPLLHDGLLLPLGIAIGLVAGSDYENPGGKYSSHENPAVRVGIAAVTQNPEILDYLSYDPCMLVRTVVAVNDFTSKETMRRLSSDPYLHVRRRTLYGHENKEELNIFDERLKLLENGEIEPSVDDIWPVVCGCNQFPSDAKDFVEVFIEENDMYVPMIPSGLSELLRQFDELFWSTQPFPSPMQDYSLESQKYLRGSIPDQYSITHWGHGVNSYSLNFRFALGDLAILSQVAWFGVYNDSEVCIDNWNKMAQELDELIQLKNRKYSNEIRSRRYLIIASNFRLPTAPELWENKNGQWAQISTVKSFSDITKIVNG